METSVSPTLSYDVTSMGTLSSSNISPPLCLPPPFHSVDFGKETIQSCIAVEAMLRVENVMLGIGWLAYQPSDSFDHVSTPVVDRALVMFIPSHILESV